MKIFFLSLQTFSLSFILLTQNYTYMSYSEEKDVFQKEARLTENTYSKSSFSFDSSQKISNIKNQPSSQFQIVDKEIILDPSKVIMSKTDAKGIIEYANDYFVEISGYEDYELMGRPHSIIRHPDMPRVIYKVLWERLSEGKNIHALVKNRAKDGRYYWVLTDFETKYDDKGNIISHYARRKAAPGHAVFQIEKLYKTLRSIEQTQNMSVAERYFSGLLEEKKMSYDEFILSILGVKEDDLNSYYQSRKKGVKAKKEVKTKKRSTFSKLFKK